MVRVPKFKPKSAATSTVEEEEEEGTEAVMTFLRAETMTEFSCSAERRRIGDGGNVREGEITVNRYRTFVPKK